MQERELARGRNKAEFRRVGRQSTLEHSLEGEGGIGQEDTGPAPWKTGILDGSEEG